MRTTARSLSALSLLLLLGNGRAEDEIAFRVPAGTRLERTFTQALQMELESMSFSIDGEEVPEDLMGTLEMSMDRSDRYVVADLFEEVDGGRPVRIVRTFEELGGHETMTYSDGEEEQKDETEYESELEGKSVVLSWDEDSERFEIAFAEADEEAPEWLLEELEEDMDLRGLLPEAEVEEGDSWEVDVRVFDDTMEPGGDLHLVDPEEGEDESEDDFDENLSGTITCTYRGTQEEDGRKLALIAVEAEVETFDESEGVEGEELPEGVEGSEETRLGFTLQGELRWDLEGGHALSYELSGESRMTLQQSMSMESEGGTVVQVQRLEFAGSMGFTLELERGE